MAHAFRAELDFPTLMEGVNKAKANDKTGAAVDFLWVGGCGLFYKQGGARPIVGAAPPLAESAVSAMSDDDLVAAIEHEAPAPGTVSAGGWSSGLLLQLLMEFIKRYL